MGAFPQVGVNIKNIFETTTYRYDWIPKDGDLLWV